MKKLLDDLEKARKDWRLTDEHINEFNKSWNVKINTFNKNATPESNETLNKNIHLESLNKSWENFKDNAFNTAWQLKNEIFDAAKKWQDITKAANNIKTNRTDKTRGELLKTTGDFKDKQDKRYQEVNNIVDRQKNIANREANIAAAKAGRYWDIYSDWEMANIKNNVIKKYWTNISNAEQYALNTNRTIDNDLLNVWLKEVADKDKRDAFKNVLLDKENSYMLNAVKEASEWNKKAIQDVGNFYNTYVKLKANDQFQRSQNTDRRADFEKEFATLDSKQKTNMLHDLTYKLPGFNIVADRLPALINKYPSLSLDELRLKVEKIANLWLTWSQQIPVILSKPEKNRTDAEKALVQNYLKRSLEEQQRSDRHTSTTQNLSQRLNKWTYYNNNVNDSTDIWKQIISDTEKNQDNIRKQTDKKVLENKWTTWKTYNISKSKISELKKRLTKLKNTDTNKYIKTVKALKKAQNEWRIKLY